jgi:hypothetical protein
LSVHVLLKRRVYVAGLTTVRLVRVDGTEDSSFWPLRGAQKVDEGNIRE